VLDFAKWLFIIRFPKNLRKSLKSLEMNSSRSYRISSPRQSAAACLRALSFEKAGGDASEHKQPVNRDTSTLDPGGGASA
jgi:hypothetical protein